MKSAFRDWSHGVLAGLLAALLFQETGHTEPAPAANSNAMALCVMTFNLRYASTNPPNSWPERRPVTRACIRRAAPDLIGIQEGLYWQLSQLLADLPEYDWIGLGRKGGSRDEYSAVLFRRDRFEPVEYDHFWLSDTPQLIGSATWGNQITRMVTWARLRERASGREFYFWNTHLDHQSEPARQKGARLIAERVRALKTSLPVILTGDFNAYAGDSKAYEILLGEGGFADTWPLAAERVNERLNSFHSYKKPAADGKRIDWILVESPVKVSKTEIVDYAEHGQYPSDHFPVVVWMELPAAR